MAVECKDRRCVLRRDRDPYMDLDHRLLSYRRDQGRTWVRGTYSTRSSSTKWHFWFCSLFPSTMAESNPPRAVVRKFKSEDEKQVRFMVGQAQMEHLAFANNRGAYYMTPFRCPTFAYSQVSSGYFHPLTLAVWIAFSSTFCQYMGWWPNPEHGILGYISFLPAFFAPAVPILFFIDW